MKFIDIMDEAITGGSERRARNYGDKGIESWQDVEVPELEDIDPEAFKWQGDWNPTTITAPDALDFEGFDPRLADLETVDRSNFGDIATDPRLQNEQMDSLNALDDIISGGGMTLSDEANLGAIQSDVAQADRGRREAIQQGMAQRGMGGSGMDLLAQLDSSQAATDRASQAGMDVAGMAQQRALDAIMNSGNMAGQMRGQDFGEQAQVAQAQDAISQFNAQNANAMNQYNTGAQNQGAQYNSAGQNSMNQYNQGVGMQTQQYNADAQNQAGMYNTTGRQATADANTQTANDAQVHNKFTAPNATFDMSASRANGLSGAYGGAMNNQQVTAQRRKEGMKEAGEISANTMSGMMSGGGA